MIELLAFKNSEPAFLDIGSGDVSLNYKFAEAGSVMDRHGSYSNSFRLPFTSTNNQFFSHYYDVNISDGSFNANAKTNCEVRFKTITLIEGYAQLKSVDLYTKTYEVAIAGNTTDLFTLLSKNKLSELFNSTDYDYVPSAENVVDSWDDTNDITTGSVGAGIIQVPFADYGNSLYNHLFANNEFTVGVQLQDTLKPYNLKPTIKVSALVDEIMKSAGFTIESDWMDTEEYTKLCMLLATDKTILPVRPFYGFRVGLDADVTLTEGDYTEITNFTDEAAPNFHDTDGFVTSGTFTAQNPMAAYFNISCIFDNTPLSDTHAVTIYAILNGDVQSTPITTFYVPDTTDISATPFVTDYQIFLNDGDTLTFLFYVNGVSDFDLVSDPLTYIELDQYQSISYSDGTTGEPISIAQSMPNMTGADFFKALVQRFNLCVVPSDSDPTIIKIEPMVNYLGTGAQRDWTDKVDRDKSFLIKPTSSLKDKTILFSDGVDNDFPNQWINENTGKPLGEYEFDSGDDFATKESNTGSKFGSFEMTQLPRNDWNGSDFPDFVYPRLYGLDNSGDIAPVTMKPKFMYDNGLKDAGGSFYVGDEPFTQYGMFSPFLDSPVADDTTVLRWVHDRQVAQSSINIGQTLGQGYVRKFWSEYLYDIYSEDARILECMVVLTPADIRAFRFNDLIYIDNAVYRVMNISGYKPAEATKVKVTFLKIINPDVVHLDPTYECNDTISSFNLDGTITWVGAGGGDCCLSEGYTFANGECWWRFVNYETGNGLSDLDIFNPNGSANTKGFIPPTPDLETKSILGDQASGLFQTYHVQTISINNASAILTNEATNKTSSKIRIEQGKSAMIKIDLYGADFENSQTEYGGMYYLTAKNTNNNITISAVTEISAFPILNKPTVTATLFINPITSARDMINISVQGGVNPGKVFFVAEIKIIQIDTSVADYT